MKLSSIGIVAGTFFAVLPFFTIGNLLYGDVNSKFFYLVTFVDLLALFVGYKLFTSKKSISIGGRYIVGALALILFIQHLSAFFGVAPERSFWSDIFWATGTNFLTHLTVLLVLLGEYLNERDWSVVRRWVAVSGGFFAFLTILGLDGFEAMSRFLWIGLEQRSLTLGNDSYAGAYVLIAFVLGLMEVFRTKWKSAWNITLLISLVLMFLSPLLFFTGMWGGSPTWGEALADPKLFFGSARASGAALFALLGFLAGYFALSKFLKGSVRTQAKIAWSAAVLLALSASVVLLFTPNSPVQKLYIDASTAARVIVWDVSLDSFAQKPLLGWGPENFNQAFERNFDNRIFEEKNLGEIWFERAHNVFLDTLVTTGILGLLSFILLGALYLLVIYRAHKKKLISETDAVIMSALLPVHLLQMQTGFDTVATYILGGSMLGYAMTLERMMAREGKQVSESVAKGTAVVLILLALVSLKFVVLDEYGRESALLHTMTSKSAQEQKQAIEESLARVSSFESLRLSYLSFVKGSLALLAKDPTPQKTKVVLEFMQIYEKHFASYVAYKPDHYRARINYAYLLLLETALGENKLKQAEEQIKIAYELSKNHPLTYIMDSTAHLYGGDIKGAERLMGEALAINPDVDFTKEASAWLEKQKKQFPNISVLRIGNL